MSGNSIGKLFTLTSFGESHGPAIGGVVDGCPPGLALTESDIQHELDRRRPGKTRHTTQRKESDQVEILSGVFSGKTTGVPIALLIKNIDQKPEDYSAIKDKFRPGHADYTYHKKYGIRDYRGGGRASARETAVRVAAGAIARKYLRVRYGITIVAYLSRLGPIVCDQHVDLGQIDSNAFFCADRSVLDQLERYVDALRREGNSVGAMIHVTARNMVPGLGEPVYDRLDADIAHAMMSINAVKGVGIGAGFDCVAQKGTEHRDEITPDGFQSNHAGGILGGISSGQDIEVDIAFKPTSSIRLPGKTIDENGNQVDISTTGRHDPCVALRAVPIVESMLAIVLMDHTLRHRAQNMDVKSTC